MAIDLTYDWAQIPPGMRDMDPTQARHRRYVESVLLDVFMGHGYDMVSSGVLEYVDTLLRGRSASESDTWIQWFDASGRAVALRPDMTPSVARMAAPLLTSGVREIKWCYAERVYARTTDPASLAWSSGKAGESTQVGLEWIGGTGECSDYDLLRMCSEGLQSIGMSQWKIVVSHARFAHALLRVFGVPTGRLEILMHELARGNFVGVRKEFLSWNPSVDIVALLGTLDPAHDTQLPQWVMTKCAASESGHDVIMHWNDLIRLAMILKEADHGAQISFDLSLNRNVGYYSGIIFEAFAKGVGAPIAYGGRYDNLLANFGQDAPALGFTFELERVLSVLGDAVRP